MRPNRTPPPYVAKAAATADLASVTPGGIKISFASKSEANQNRMRFYQARKALLKINPSDVSPLSTVETKIVETAEGADLEIYAAGEALFSGQIKSIQTGELLDTKAIREAVPSDVGRVSREMEILEALWLVPRWAEATPQERDAEVSRIMEEEGY